MFWAEIWKILEFFYLKICQFLVVRFSIYLNRRVFVMSYLVSVLSLLPLDTKSIWSTLSLFSTETSSSGSNIMYHWRLCVRVNLCIIKLTMVLLNPDMPWFYWTQICPDFANSSNPDQLASEGANWSGSALFVIKYVNSYQTLGSSNLMADN